MIPGGGDKDFLLYSLPEIVTLLLIEARHVFQRLSRSGRMSSNLEPHEAGRSPPLLGPPLTYDKVQIQEICIAGRENSCTTAKPFRHADALNSTTYAMPCNA